LIVDHEAKSLDLLEAILDDPCYPLVRYPLVRYPLVRDESGKPLLALLVNGFALPILDVRMPRRHGKTLADQLIKARKKTANVVIIFLTACRGEDRQIVERYDSGSC
jgi:CheY-like chemotaxis protein